MIKIIQKRLFNPTQDIRLTDDDFVEITLKRILSERSFKLDLREFDSEASHQKSIPRNPVALATILGLLTLTGLVPLFSDNDSSQRGGYIFLAIFWGSLALVPALYAWFARSDLIVYFNRYSGKAVLTLYNRYPDAVSFNKFVLALDTRLRALNPRNMKPEEPKHFEPDNPFSFN